MWIMFHRELVKPDYAITPKIDGRGNIEPVHKGLFYMLTQPDIDATPYTPFLLKPGIWEYQPKGGAPLEAIQVNQARFRSMFNAAYKWSRRHNPEDLDDANEMTEFFKFMVRDDYTGVMDYEFANLLTDAMAKARDPFFAIVKRDTPSQHRAWYDLWYEFSQFAEQKVIPNGSYIRFTDEKPPHQRVD